mgnify:FL=1
MNITSMTKVQTHQQLRTQPQKWTMPLNGTIHQAELAAWTMHQRWSAACPCDI